MMKSAFITAVMVVGLTALLNQFEGSRQLLSGGNKFFR